MLLAVLDPFNDCSFGIKFEDNTQIDKVKELALEGLQAWYSAAHMEIEPTEHFTIEDIEAMYGVGYAEPTSELLTMFGIEHEITDLEEDDDDNVICDDSVVY